MLTKAGSGDNIPSLQRSDGTGVMDPEERIKEYVLRRLVLRANYRRR